MECHHIVPQAQGGENTFDNCIPLCFDCHAVVGHYSSEHPKGTKFSSGELRSHRDRWYEQSKSGLLSDAPADHLELDRNLAKRVVCLLGGQTRMQHFRDHDYHGSFSRTKHDRLSDFQLLSEKPATFFFDSLVEGAFSDLKQAISDYFVLSANRVFSHRNKPGEIGVPDEWEYEDDGRQMDRHQKSVEDMNAAASRVWLRFANFVKEVRTRLRIDFE